MPVTLGWGARLRLHCIGAGAPGIAEQVQRVFGAQATSWVDFDHLCDYLAAAAPGCAGEPAAHWRAEQKQRLRDGPVRAVVTSVQAHLEPAAGTAQEGPVQVCHRYRSPRLEQVDYAGALPRQLPMGSGEIESAHRYVIQKRLKLTGTWGKEDHAQHMLTLRTGRANRQWNSYWDNLAQVA